MNSVFLSRHDLTDTQVGLLVKEGALDIIQWGDVDAFMDEISFKNLVKELNNLKVELAVVVHPLLALRLSPFFRIGVFKNVNRAPLGEKQDFATTQLVVVDQIPRVAAWDPIFNHDMWTVE